MNKLIFFIILFPVFAWGYDYAIGDVHCGQIGQKACSSKSKEFWQQKNFGCDRGLKRKNGKCFSAKRNLLNNKDFSWASRTLKFQRDLDENNLFLNIPFFFAHNSYSNKSDGYALPNHFFSLTDLIDLGVRGFEWDVHYVNRKLRLCHGRSNDVGCSPYDRVFHNVVEELSLWIRNNPDEVVLIYVQEEFNNSKKGMDIYVKVMKEYLGDLVIHLDDVRTLSLKSLRKLNKRVVLDSSLALTKRIVRNDSNYREVKQLEGTFQKEASQYISKDYRLPNKTFRKIFLGDWSKPLEKVKNHYTSKKPNYMNLKMDYIRPEHVYSAIWSWKNKEPSQIGCAFMDGTGRWAIEDCNKALNFACEYDGNWFITERKGRFKEGQNICTIEYSKSRFSIPKNGYENKLVKKGIKGETWIKWKN